MPSTAPPPAITEREQAQAVFAELQQRARERGVALRSPPPEPDACCGRGCNGCVWESFYAAATFWHEDALEALAALDENARR